MGLAQQIDEPEPLRKIDNGSDIRAGETPSQWIKRLRKQLKDASKE